MYSQLIQLYVDLIGQKPSDVKPITGSGSNRMYVRLYGPVSLIGVIGTNEKENNAFIYESSFFADRNIRVPKVVAVSPDRMVYLQEDLGSEALFEILKAEGESERVVQLCKNSLLELTKMQLEVDGFDWDKCFPVKEVDRRSVMWDLNYFKYCFLKPAGVEIDEPRLEDEFEYLTRSICEATPRGFMFRDFQSRNVMVKEDEPWLIDFQGGRKGPLLYDAVSFIWQARAGFSDALKDELFNFYMDQLSKQIKVEKTFKDEIIVFRMLQVLGAYGFRGLIERKQIFIDSIPGALSTCLAYINKAQYPHIASLIQSVTERLSIKGSDSELTVYVTSFSYKRGIPKDDSGNGGGFVFDCRAIHNPGRYEPYKSQTGDDAPVIDFLERKSSVVEFLRHCYALVDESVEVYMRRGFTSLQVNFGCTGGQHRSVYCATHMAQHLSERFGVKVILTHREQNKETVFQKRK
ncbi:MAG: phosphotransferase [Muribaculaceae bacterium]|nr:phosphotransferase [Muribaculaceae bacterium]